MSEEPTESESGSALAMEAQEVEGRGVQRVAFEVEGPTSERVMQERDGIELVLHNDNVLCSRPGDSDSDCAGLR